jgi:tRNA modification GTPase
MTILSHDEQTIIAQCTPKGSGAIALLRISGIRAIELASSISELPGSKKLQDMATHTIHFGYVINQQGIHIDQVLFLLMHGPKTFTGQDTVEITCHNNPFIVADIVKSAVEAGARIAENGEFTRRAVLNNKIDLLQAEAVNELIHANTTRALKHSMSQLEGSLSSWLVDIENLLLNALALTDASFEFLDDEISFGSQIQEIINTLHTKIKTLINSCDKQEQIRNGIRIAILGTVNAGKSSLFNSLLAQDRAIVTDIPGTTRDTIEAGLYKDGNYLTIIDTAGIRQTNDIIENQGIERSLKEAIKADIILLVLDASRSITQEEQTFYKQCIDNHSNKIILVRNKVDSALDKNLIFGHTCIDCSCKTKQNIDTIKHAIATKITALFDSIDAPFLLNERHAHLLGTLDQKLVIIESMAQEPIQYELLSEHIKDALSCISELTGKTISTQAMDKIFSQFCVGK